MLERHQKPVSGFAFCEAVSISLGLGNRFSEKVGECKLYFVPGNLHLVGLTTALTERMFTLQ
jgi:hypothetical protein